MRFTKPILSSLMALALAPLAFADGQKTHCLIQQAYRGQTPEIFTIDLQSQPADRRTLAYRGTEVRGGLKFTASTTSVLRDSFERHFVVETEKGATIVDIKDTADDKASGSGKMQIVVTIPWEDGSWRQMVCSF